jgi:single-strand DNA-binding protein
MNKLIGLGRLGKDPELRYTGGNNTPLLAFSVATSRKVDGSERTTWVDCTVWGKRAEGLANVLRKGSHVYFEGPLECRKYEDKNGNKRESWGVYVDDIQLLSPPATRANYQQPAQGSESQSKSVQPMDDGDTFL